MTGIINWKGSGSKESQNSFKILSQLLMDATSKNLRIYGWVPKIRIKSILLYNSV
jgi:hypothetical protein